MENNRSLVKKDQSLMEYAPREMTLVEFNPNPNHQPPASFRDFLRILFRHKKMIFFTFAAVTAIVSLGLQTKVPLYEARVKLLIRAEKQVESPYYRDLDGSFKTEVALTQSEIVESNPVLERTVKELDLHRRPVVGQMDLPKVKQFFKKFLKQPQSSGGPEEDEVADFSRALNELRSNVKVKPISSTNLFYITVRDVDPKMAALIANTISRYYIIFDLEQQLAELLTKYGEKHPAILQFRSNIASMQGGTVPESSAGSYADSMGPASVKIIERARIPNEPTGFPSSLILLLAAACGLVLGVGMAFLSEHIDPTIRSVDDVSYSLNLPVIGSVPMRKFGAKILKEEPFIQSRYVKSFESLADQIHMSAQQQGIRSVLFASVLSGEGATLVAQNTGIYLSRALGHKVLLIDANLRHPALHRAFNIPKNGGGLSDVLNGKLPLSEAIWPVNDKLSILQAGSPERNPLALLGSPALADLLSQAGETYEIILIDSPALKDFRDAEALTSTAQGVVLVIEAGHARRQTLKSYLAALEQKKVNFLGAVLNKRIFYVPELIYDRV